MRRCPRRPRCCSAGWRAATPCRLHLGPLGGRRAPAGGRRRDHLRRLARRGAARAGAAAAAPTRPSRAGRSACASSSPSATRPTCARCGCGSRTRARSPPCTGAARPTSTAARARVEAIAREAEAAGLATHWGRKVLELRPPGPVRQGPGGARPGGARRPAQRDVRRRRHHRPRRLRRARRAGRARARSTLPCESASARTRDRPRSSSAPTWSWTAWTASGRCWPRSPNGEVPRPAARLGGAVRRHRHGARARLRPRRGRRGDQHARLRGRRLVVPGVAGRDLAGPPAVADARDRDAAARGAPHEHAARAGARARCSSTGSGR